MASPRVAVRAIIIANQKLLLVNATQDKDDGKWCTPGGRVEDSEKLDQCLIREVQEETGLDVEVGELCAVSEFFDHTHDVHQIDLFFRASAKDLTMADDLVDIAAVVSKREFFSLQDMKNMQVFPACLKDGFWLQPTSGVSIYKGYEERE